MTTRQLRRAATTTAAAATLALLAACGEDGTGDRAVSADGTPPTSALAAGTHLGAVEITTADEPGLRRFYTRGVGLEVLERTDEATLLGSDGTGLLRLVVDDAPADDPSEAGLYHSAFLYDEASELAPALLRSSQIAGAAYQGSADHTVSLAFYLGDPDGNGVELYLDRPVEGWEWTEEGVTMGSAPLDPNAFIGENLDEADLTATPDGVTLGHLHLRAGDLEEARAFYQDALGLALTARTDGAIFLSAGGYHHHLGVNTWTAAGAGQRPDSLGLRVVRLAVPDVGELDALATRLEEAGVAAERDGDTVTTTDPWRTTVVVTVQA
ncbi:VOC family protein [Nocardioides bruguierae]|uniref:VOC family protein n=1 Tax=Nocardioides bruguierae TaxID=2945102 RepID=A0A9X2IDQ1_9ACTN|nr:VOC family protein [Nocardioides bruguierae]MCM0619492.1 VOC family protein [Nocardioides bruguierae]